LHAISLPLSYVPFWFRPFAVELPQTSSKNIRVCQPQGVARPVDSLRKAYVVRILNGYKGGLKIGKNIIEGDKLSKISLIPIGPYPRMSTPIAKDRLGVFGAGVVQEMNHQIRPFLIQQTLHRLLEVIQVAVKG
jgi:hypothetical protein